MKNETVKVLCAVFGTVLVIVLFGLVWASFVTLVVGLFIVFPFTLVNVLKVWLAVVVINFTIMGLKISK